MNKNKESEIKEKLIISLLIITTVFLPLMSLTAVTSETPRTSESISWPTEGVAISTATDHQWGH